MPEDAPVTRAVPKTLLVMIHLLWTRHAPGHAPGNGYVTINMQVTITTIWRRSETLGSLPGPARGSPPPPGYSIQAAPTTKPRSSRTHPDALLGRAPRRGRRLEPAPPRTGV